MGSNWVINCSLELTGLKQNLEGIIKNHLELKSQLNELDYKIIQETKKQQTIVFNKRTSSNTCNLELTDLDAELVFEDTTADQTNKFIPFDQSAIKKDNNTKLNLFDNSKRLSSEDIRNLVNSTNNNNKNQNNNSNKKSDFTSKNSSEIKFTSYNEFSNKFQKEENHNNFYKTMQNEKESMEKTHEKFVMSLKESKFETLVKIANVRTTHFFNIKKFFFFKFLLLLIFIFILN